MYYSIAGRDIEREIVPLAVDQGLGILPWSPLAGGLLTGKFDLESRPAKVDGRAPLGLRLPARRSRRAPPRVREGAAHGRRTSAASSVARVALAWLLAQPYVTSVIIGAKNDEQLADNLAATELTLTPEELASARRRERAAAGVPGLDGRLAEPRQARVEWRSFLRDRVELLPASE